MSRILAELRMHARVSILALLGVAALALPQTTLAQSGLVLDPALNVEVLDPAAANVYQALPLAGGGTLAAGRFIYVNGEVHQNLVRLQADGSVDTTFVPAAIDGAVVHLVAGPNGTIYIAGAFSTVGGVARPGLARLNADGTLDPTFASTTALPVTGPRAIHATSDGGLYVAYVTHNAGTSAVRIDRLTTAGGSAPGFTPILREGAFLQAVAFGPDDTVVLVSIVNGTNPFPELVRRYRSDGTRDPAFLPPEQHDLSPMCVLIAGDGSLYLGGTPSSYGSGLVRLRPDGSLDESFSGATPFSFYGVRDIIALVDGSLVVHAGGFSEGPPPALMRFSANGVYDGTFVNDAATAPENVTLRLRARPDGGFLVLGGFARIGDAPIAHLAHFEASGSLRTGVKTEFNETGLVTKLVPFAGDSMLVGGAFTQVGGQMRGGVVRLSASDVVDATFPGTDGQVNEIIIDNAGRAVVLGDFSAVEGTTSSGAFRVAGTQGLDTSFMAGVQTGIGEYGPAAVLGDGSLVLARSGFTGMFGTPGIVKLLPAGGVDQDFQLNTLDTAKGPQGRVTALAVDGSNRLILSGGDYSTMLIQGVERPGIARTDASGVLDATFAPAVGLAYAGRQIEPLADGGFFIVGRPSDQPQSSPQTLVRFQSNGAIDAGFDLAVEENVSVGSYVLTPDGALLVATTGDRGRSQVRRFSMAGVLDPSFAIDVGTQGTVSSMAFDARGRLWLGGQFAEVNGQRRLGLARFALPELFVSIDGPAQVVLAGGAGHQLSATVEGGSGTISYQWYLNGVAVAGATGPGLQVADFAAGKAGRYTVTATQAGVSKTSNAVELLLPVLPTITRAPSGVSAVVGGSVVLRVGATGLPAPTYQWFRNGTLITGATSSELRLRNLTTADVGSYTVRVSNIAGPVTSSPAMVVVESVAIDPTFRPAAVSVQANTHAGLAAGPGGDSVFVSVYAGESINGESRDGLYLLRSDATLDASFAIAGRRIAPPLLLLPDGTGYALEDVASLTEFGSRLRRISPSGGIDPDFRPHFPASYEVVRVGVLGDGRVMAAGAFTHVNGVARAGLVRFLANGSVDAGFSPAADLTVSDAVILPDGSSVVLLIEGGQPVLRRLQPSGAVDTSFAAVQVGGAGHRTWLNRLQDGSYLLLGNFSTVNGVARNQSARVLANGTLASDFASRPGGGNIVGATVLADGSVRYVTREGTSGWSDETYRVVGLDATGAVMLDRTHTLTMNYSGGSVSVAILPGGAVVFAGALIAVNEQSVAGFARISAAGDVDTTFQPRLGRHEWVHSVCALANGRWAIGGRFTELAGAPRAGLGVVGPDGRLDTTFVPDVGENAGISRVDRLEGDRLLVTGYFPPFSSGTATESIIVLEADGTRNPSHDGLFSGGVSVAAVSSAGHLYLATPVLDAPSHPTVRITRRHPDLAADASFAPVTIQGGLSAEAMSDGRIFLYTENGTIVDAAGTSRTGLCRITREGVVDTTFTPPLLSHSYNVLPREAPGGKLVITGLFTTVNGVNRAAIARLNDDGSLDTSFTPPTSGLPSNPFISTFAVDPSGRILIFGKYRSSRSLGVHESVLTRLNADGSWDSGIDYVIDTFLSTGISVITPRENGDVVVAGSFPGLGGSPNLSIARITSNRFQASAVREHVAIPAGGSGFLQVRLSGPVTLPSYRWTKDGQPVSDGDRAVLALRDFSAAGVGSYRVEVTSAEGSTVPSEIVEVALSTATTSAALTPLVFAETGGVGGIRVDAPGGSVWSVSGMPSWVHVMPSALTTGSRTVNFVLDANRTGAERTATVTIAGRAFDIRQRSASGRLVNISTRGRVGTGDDALIVGIVTEGSESMDFLGRGVGPTLAAYGVGSVLPNPSMELTRRGVLVDRNDDWDTTPDRELIINETLRVGAFALAANGRDAALLTHLPAGAYTARIFDASGGEGVALAEFYDRTAPASMDPYTRAMNISTRGRVGAGDDVLIAGFVITGTVPKQVLVRGVGPRLADFGIAEYLADPSITLVRGGVIVAENNDWAYSPQRDVIAAAALNAGAFELDPAGRDAALVVTLEPGSYTALLSGADGGEGIALVEVYDLE